MSPARRRTVRHAAMRGAAAVTLTLSAGCAGDPVSPSPDPRLALFAAPCAAPAPLLLAPGEKVPDRFIVVYDFSTADPGAVTSSLEARHGFTATYRYGSALKGFAAELTPAMVGALRCEAAVEYIEEDGKVSIG